MSKKATAVMLPSQAVKKIDQGRPAADQISESIRAAILEMNLKPGQMISETEVGNLYGASRTPVREAFTWLREQGLIVTLPSRGNYVSKLSIPQIKGAQFAREALEIAIAEHLCHHGLSAQTVHELEDNLAQQDKMLRSGDGAAFHALDDSFHLTMAEAVGHPRIGDIVKKEKAYLDRLRVLSLNQLDHIADLVQDHRDIFASIQSGDPNDVKTRVRTHSHRVLQTLNQLFEAHRDYFDDD